MTQTFRILLFTVLLAPFTAAHCAQSPASALEILIVAFHDKQWQVRYELPRPATELVFAYSSDESRRQKWLADVLFEIVSTPQGEVVRRKDGSEFTTVRIRLSPELQASAGSPAPFSTFGDGGVAFRTSRFLACPGPCASGATWSFSLWADPDDAIVLDGKRQSYSTQWSDNSAGRTVYIGKPADAKALLDAKRAG